MGAVTMFARHGCPFCERAKQMLTDLGIPFEAIYLGDGITMSSVRTASGSAKAPRCSWTEADRGRGCAAGLSGQKYPRNGPRQGRMTGGVRSAKLSASDCPLEPPCRKT